MIIRAEGLSFNLGKRLYKSEEIIAIRIRREGRRWVCECEEEYDDLDLVVGNAEALVQLERHVWRKVCRVDLLIVRHHLLAMSYRVLNRRDVDQGLRSTDGEFRTKQQ